MESSLRRASPADRESESETHCTLRVLEYGEDLGGDNSAKNLGYWNINSRYVVSDSICMCRAEDNDFGNVGQAQTFQGPCEQGYAEHGKQTLRDG